MVENISFKFIKSLLGIETTDVSALMPRIVFQIHKIPIRD